MKVQCPDAASCGGGELRTFNYLLLHRAERHGEDFVMAMRSALPALDHALDLADGKRAAKTASKASGPVPVPPGPPAASPAKPATPAPPVLLPTALCSSCKGPVGAAPTVEQARRIAGSHMLRYNGHSVVVRELPASGTAGGSR